MRISILLILAISLYAQDIVALFQTALQKNYKIKSYLHQIKAQNIRFQEAKERLYPSVSLSLNYGKDRYEYRYPAETKRYDQIVKGYTFSLKQPLYQPKIFALMKENRLKYKYIEWQKEEFLQSLYSEIAQRFIDVLKFTELDTIYQNQYINYQKIYFAIQKKRQMKILTITDELQAKAKMQMSKRNLVANRLELKQSLSKLKILTQSEELIIAPVKLGATEVFVLKKDIEENPRLKQYKFNIKIAQNGIQKSRYDFYPILQGTVTYSDTSSGDTITRRDNMRIFLQLDMPLFNKPLYTAVKEAKELYLQAKNDYLDLKNSLKMSREELLAKIDTLKEQLKADKIAQKSAEAFLLKAQRAFRYKLMSSSDYFSAQNDYYISKVRVVSDKAELLKILIQLQALYGELSDKWIKSFQKKYLKDDSE